MMEHHPPHECDCFNEIKARAGRKWSSKWHSINFVNHLLLPIFSLPFLLTYRHQYHVWHCQYLLVKYFFPLPFFVHHTIISHTWRCFCSLVLQLQHFLSFFPSAVSFPGFCALLASHGVDYIETHLESQIISRERREKPTQDVDLSDNFHSLFLFHIKTSKEFFLLNLRLNDFFLHKSVLNECMLLTQIRMEFLQSIFTDVHFIFSALCQVLWKC